MTPNEIGWARTVEKPIYLREDLHQMAKKKQFVTAAAAFAVAASAVAPAITADAASTTVQLSSDYVRGGDLDAALDKEYKGSEIYWYKSSVDMNKLGVFQTAKGFVKGQGIRVEKKLRVLNHAQDIQPEEIVLEEGVPASGLRIQPVLFADGVKYNKVVTYKGFSTEKAGEFEGTFTYSNKAFGVVTKTVKYKVVDSKVELSNVESKVSADDQLVVTGDIAKAKEDTKVEVVIFPGKDMSATPIKTTAVIKEGKFSATSVSLPAGTHSYKVVSGDVETAAMEFTVAKAEFSAKASKVNEVELKFNKNLTEVEASDFKLDNGLAVTKATIDSEDKSKVVLTINDELIDGETYKVTANNFVVASGEVKEEVAASFDFKIAKPASVTLNKTAYLGGENLLDQIVIKDENGLVVSEDTIEDRGYVFTLSSTSTVLDTDTGVVTYSNTAADNVFFVEAKVTKDGSTVATTGAVRVTVADEAALSMFEGLHIDADGSADAAAYETAKEAKELVSSIKKSGTGVLNVFAKDVSGVISEISATGATITNLTPTIATVSNSTGNFAINQIATGTAKVKIKQGDFETTVEFQVVADSKVADASLSRSSVTFDSGEVNGAGETAEVGVEFIDQYKDDSIFAGATLNAANGEVTVGGNVVGTLSAQSSNTRVATVALNGTPGSEGVTLTEGDREGSATVTVTFKDTSDKVVFTKSIAVKRTEFDAVVAGYDLEITSSNKSLDADNDTDEGASGADDSVTFQVVKLDKNGNRLGVEAGAVLEATYSTSSHEDYLELAGSELAFENEAAIKFAESGKATIKARVNGVLVDTITVDYTNTDSVAKKATVATAMRTLDLSTLTGATAAITEDQLLYGILDTNDKYTLAPIVSVMDQFGKVIAFDKDAAAGTLMNGVNLNVTPVITNKVNVTEAGGSLSLTDPTKAGSFTVVIPQISTTENGDLLASPVSFEVKLVR